MYDTVLFDFFGVIFADPIKAWANKHGHADNPAVAATARLLDTGVISYDEYVERLAAIGGHAAKDLRTQFQSSTLLDSPMVETIAELGKHKRVGLLSNTCTEEITPLFEQHGLDDLFHTVVISSETGLAKPDHKIFELTLERLGSKAETTVFVDDNAKNVAAAAEVGLTTIHFQDVHQLKRELQKLGVTANPVGQEA
jgi:HAD superfamily hydrolase (TIGR01509 family)